MRGIACVILGLPFAWLLCPVMGWPYPPGSAVFACAMVWAVLFQVIETMGEIRQEERDRERQDRLELQKHMMSLQYEAEQLEREVANAQRLRKA